MSNILLIIIAVVIVIVVIIGARRLSKNMQRPSEKMLNDYEAKVSALRDSLNLFVDKDTDYYIVDNRSKKDITYVRNLSFDNDRKLMFTAYSAQNGKKTDNPKWEIIPFTELQDCKIILEGEEIASVRKSMKENEGKDLGGSASVIGARDIFNRFNGLKTVTLLSVMFPRNNEASGMYVLPLISSKTATFDFEVAVCEQLFAVMYAIIEENFRGGYIVEREEDEDEDEEDEDDI
ncbi:MAG: hypothetical protein LUD47_06230 [Clostridia bacterium]|nr:hypothetical protein [Clostridia bacterium]